MSPVKKEYSEKIPVIQFLMLLEVMLYHLELMPIREPVSGFDSWLNQLNSDIIWGELTQLCMSWFFAITAFLLFRNLSFHNLGTKLISRVKTLLVPYTLWCLIYVVKSIFQGNSWTLRQVFEQTFLLRVWPPMPAFWYIYAVFLLSLLSPIFLILFRNEKIGWVSSATVIVLLYVFWSNIHIGNGYPHYTGNIKSFFPAYVVGAFYGHIYDDSTIQRKLKYMAAFLVVGILLTPAVENLLSHMAIAIMPMFILFVVPVPEWMKNRKLYRLNFLIYATHQAIISLTNARIRNVLLSMIPYVSIANILGRILCILVIIAVNFGIHALMSRFTPKTLKLLTGGRS